MKNVKALTTKQLAALLHTPFDEMTKAFPGHTRRYLNEQKKKLLEDSAGQRLVREAEDKARVAETYRRATESKNKVLLKELKTAQQQLDAISAVSAAYEPITLLPIKSKGKRAYTAVAIASDWHMEEPVLSETVNGLNKFNLKIAGERAARYFESLVSLIKLYQTKGNLDRLIWQWGGDFFSGFIHDDLVESNQLGIIDAAILVQNTLAAGMEYVRAALPDLEILVVCNIGNHGRLTLKKRIQTARQNSLEYLLYHNLARELTQDGITFLLPEGYHTYVDLYGYHLRFHHGDEIRYGGGVGGITIPVNKALAEWDKARHADYDFLGHFHQMLNTNKFLVNGSLIGYSPFSIAIKGSFEPPRQAFCLIDSKYGKTVADTIIVT